MLFIKNDAINIKSSIYFSGNILNNVLLISNFPITSNIFFCYLKLKKLKEYVLFNDQKIKEIVFSIMMILKSSLSNLIVYCNNE